jgi:hypothetical protein
MVIDLKVPYDMIFSIINRDFKCLQQAPVASDPILAGFSPHPSALLAGPSQSPNRLLPGHHEAILGII